MKLFQRPLQSWGKLRREPATRWFDGSFAPIPWSDERFARQYRFGLPSGFPLTSSSLGIVHHLSGPNMFTITFVLTIQPLKIRSQCLTTGLIGLVGNHRIVRNKLMMLPNENFKRFLIKFHVDSALGVFLHSHARRHVRLLGPCFKTGQLKSYLLIISLPDLECLFWKATRWTDDLQQFNLIVLSGCYTKQKSSQIISDPIHRHLPIPPTLNVGNRDWEFLSQSNH